MKPLREKRRTSGPPFLSFAPLLLDHRLDRGHHLPALFLRARHQVRELVENGEDLLLAAQPEEDAEEIRHIGESGAQAQRPLERSGELPQLGPARAGLGDEKDSGLLVGKGAEQPRLPGTAAPV